MACEEELKKVNQLAKDRNDAWDDMISKGLLGLAALVGTGAAIVGSVASAGTLSGPGAAAAGSSFLVATVQADGAIDAANDYDLLTDQYYAACDDYRDCIGY